MPKKVKNEQETSKTTNPIAEEQVPSQDKDSVPPGAAHEKTSEPSQPGAEQNPPPKPPEKDAASPKQDDPLLGRVGEAIQTSSAAAEASAHELVVQACKCGLLLAFGKSIAPRGTFDEWCDAQKFRFSKMSRSKYMRLAEQLCKKGQSKSDLLLAVERGPDGRPSGFKVDQDKLREVVQKVCQNRSLTELYLDWGIAAKTAAAKKSQPASQVRGQASFRRWLQSLDNAAPIIRALPQAQRSEVVEKLEALLHALKSESSESKQ